MEVSDGKIKASEAPLSDAANTERKPQSRAQKQRSSFYNNLTSLWGFRKPKNKRSLGKRGSVEFVKVDAESDMRVAQGKMPRIFNTKMSKTLDSLFDAWTSDVYDTYTNYQDRLKRLAELEFAILNDPFLGQAADLYADESSQIDSQDTLINIDCADARMKQKMEDLLNQWGVTQNRVRSVMYTLAWAGDAFWSAKVTPSGVIRINPINVHQVTERLEFDPILAASQLALNNDMVTALSKDAKLQMMLDTLEADGSSEFADMFDKKLFGFVLDGNMVVPPWNIVHFRLNADQSEFYPMGKSLFLKALAPFRQYNATSTLQSLARVMSFPITAYEISMPPGLDVDEVWAKVEETREQYDNLGEAGNNSETMSVNTRIWMPKDFMSIEVHSPNIDLNSIGDLELYQDRVAIASGVPKGYLNPEMGVFGNSAISLIEQFKPFARRAFTIQSAFLEGLSNLFRIHFAITGEFDYRETFTLSMKFPNEETSAERQQAKNDSLELSKSVLDTVSSIIGAIDDPLPQEVIQDILSKFSFLTDKDIRKWIKPNPLAKQVDATASDSEGLGDSGGDLGGGASIGGGGGDTNAGFEDSELDLGTEEVSTDEGIDLDTETGEEPEEAEANTEEDGVKLESTRKRNPRLREAELKKRYQESSQVVYTEVMKVWTKIDETVRNGRHYRNTSIAPDMDLMLTTLEGAKTMVGKPMKSLKETVRGFMNKYEGSLPTKTRESWNQMKEDLKLDEEQDTDGFDIGEEELDVESEEFLQRRDGAKGDQANT
ncbi:MAG: portal protein [Eubacteriales bacterium]|jgi:hypothetical protein